MTLWIFSANTSPSAPPKTVKSCEKTNTFRPSIVPQPGDDAVGQGAGVLDAEAVRPMAGEHVELDERAGVEQLLEPLACGELAAVVLARRPTSRYRRAAPARAAPRAARAVPRSGAAQARRRPRAVVTVQGLDLGLLLDLRLVDGHVSFPLSATARERSGRPPARFRTTGPEIDAFENGAVRPSSGRGTDCADDAEDPADRARTTVRCRRSSK